MTKLSVTDPRTLYGVVTELGGTVIPGPTFRFEIRKDQIVDVIPPLNKLGVRAEYVSECVRDDPRTVNRVCSFTTVALFKEKE